MSVLTLLYFFLLVYYQSPFQKQSGTHDSKKQLLERK